MRLGLTVSLGLWWVASGDWSVCRFCDETVRMHVAAQAIAVVAEDQGLEVQI